MCDITRSPNCNTMKPKKKLVMRNFVFSNCTSTAIFQHLFFCSHILLLILYWSELSFWLFSRGMNNFYSITKIMSVLVNIWYLVLWTRGRIDCFFNSFLFSSSKEVKNAIYALSVGQHRVWDSPQTRNTH